MSNTEKIIFGILLTISAILVIVNWDKIKKLFSSEPSKADGQPCTVGDMVGVYKDGICGPSTPVKSEYEKCVELNKTTADGAECNNCIPEGSTIASYKGIIANGICQPKPEVKYSNKIKITKSGGAKVYSVVNGSFVSAQNAAMVAEGLTLIITQYVTTPGIYYKTEKGWIGGNDATVVAA